MEYPSEVFTVETELAEDLLHGFPEFLAEKYIARYPPEFSNIRREKVDDVEILGFEASPPGASWKIVARIEVGQVVRINLDRFGEVPETYINRLREDIIIGVQYFEEEVRRRTFYLTFSPYEQIRPVHEPGSRGRLGNIFGDSMVNFFILSIFFSVGLYAVFGALTPIIMILFQSLMVVFSDRIITRMGDWRLTEENPSLDLLQYHLDPEEMKSFGEGISETILSQIKTEIFNKTLRVGREIDCATAQEILARHGIHCKPENMLVRRINLYEMVEKASRLFNLPVPKITVSNTMVPNAAATGVAPQMAAVMVTTGAMVQLEEDELLSVIGHEMSHIKSRDPVSLFILTSAEYLLRVYVFFPLLFMFGFFYYIFALGGIYFIGKFFEARCDLESAVMMGSSKPMASALRKIGFTKLIFERSPQARLIEWFSWDPHPPTYFRISRLEKITDVNMIQNPLLTSIKDCIQGVIASIRSF